MFAYMPTYLWNKQKKLILCITQSLLGLGQDSTSMPHLGNTA